MGTVVPSSSGGVNVLGSHTYTTSPGGTGAFTITTTLTAASGASLQATARANVSVVPISLTAQLNPASDSGLSNQDGITNNTQPNFNGTSEPGAVVTLVAQPTGGGSAFQIAQTGTSTGGFWNVNSSTLSNGSYTITAVANDSSGQTTTTTIEPASHPLVIDTAAPGRAHRFQPDRRPDQHPPPGQTVRLQSGQCQRPLLFVHERGREELRQPRPGRHGAATRQRGHSETVLLTIKGGKKIKTGTYTLKVPAGIDDLAGNSLGQTLVYTVKPAKKTVVPAAAKPAALTVHDAALHAVHASAAHHRRGK